MATRAVVETMLSRLAAGDLDGLAELFAEQVDWAMDWPMDHPAARDVPWIRRRPDKQAVRQHFSDLASHTEPADPGTQVDRILVDDEDAVVLATLRQRVTATGQVFEASAAIHLTVRDGRIHRYHVYEDSLAVALAAGAVRHARS